MADDFARIRATEYVLQRYHLTDLQDAQEKLSPTQFEGLMREISQVHAQLTTQTRPQPAVADVRGIRTPFGPILPVTGLLLIIIWIIFGLESFQPQPGGSENISVLFTFGAVAPDTFALGQYWRLLAACFLHIGILHIIMNSIALIYLGSLAERLYGPLRFLGIYLAAGVGGNILAVLTQPALGAGASGAIFGLLGALLVGAWRNRKVLNPAASRLIISGLAPMLVLNIAISFTPGISWSAHFGGAITGAILALIIPVNSPRYPRAYTLATNILSAVLIVAALALGVTYIGAH